VTRREDNHDIITSRSLANTTHTEVKLHTRQTRQWIAATAAATCTPCLLLYCPPWHYNHNPSPDSLQ